MLARRRTVCSKSPRRSGSMKTGMSRCPSNVAGVARLGLVAQLIGGGEEAGGLNGSLGGDVAV